MDTPDEERGFFDHVTCNISASVDEVTVPGALAWDLIEQVYKHMMFSGLLKQFMMAVYSFLDFVLKTEVEVERLDQLKSSRMKEIAFKKQSELEEIFTRAHIEIDPEAARDKIMELIDSGNVEPTELLADMDDQIAKARDEALSRKDILDKVEKWMSACEEESWLEDYNRVIKLSLKYLPMHECELLAGPYCGKQSFICRTVLPIHYDRLFFVVVVEESTFTMLPVHWSPTT